MPDLTDNEISMTHIIADSERKRTSAVRTMTRAHDLLADALHAVQNGRLLVTAEFIDRAATALANELANQRSE